MRSIFSNQLVVRTTQGIFSNPSLEMNNVSQSEFGWIEI
jgi:hypothetical protein